MNGPRETIVSFCDYYHTSLTRCTNEIMIVLTLYAGILLRLTLIAGIYGMNLPLWPKPDHPLNSRGVMGVMAAVATVLLICVRRGRRRSHRACAYG